MMVGTGLTTTAYNKATLTSEQKKKHDSIVMSFENFVDRQNLETQQLVKDLQKEVKEAIKTSEKVDKKVKTLQTSNRRVVGAVQKVQHQQKLDGVSSLNQQKQLDALNAKFKENHPNEETENKIISLSIPKTKASTTHIAIDGNNFSKSAKELGVKIDWKALKNYLVEFAGKTDRFTLKYYTGLHDNPSQAQKKWLDRLERLKYEVIGFPLSQQDDGNFKTVGDDTAICIELMQDAKIGDHVLLVTGDGDFVPLIEKLTAKGAKVTVIGFSFNTSHHLKQLLQENFISMESIIDKVVTLKKLNAA
jgi:uncharacterized LabA/DUF88 family protein